MIDYEKYEADCKTIREINDYLLYESAIEAQEGVDVVGIEWLATIRRYNDLSIEDVW